jgi:integrase
MASITEEQNGCRTIQFVGIDRKRRSIRMGYASKGRVEEVKLRVEELVAALKAGVRFDSGLQRWLDDADDQLHEKLAKVGLVAKRERQVTVTLKSFLDGYLKRRKDVKGSTQEIWSQPVRNLIEFFHADRDIATIDEACAEDFKQYLIDKEKLASTTISKRLQFVRMFFESARKRKLINENPFADVSHDGIVRLDNRKFVTVEETQRLLAVCDPTWRTIIALARYGGLRCPSEVLSLRWQDVDFHNRRIVVQSPKGECQGKGTREIPLFAELLPILEDARDLAPEGAVYVVAGNYRDAANTPSGWRNCNLRTTFMKLVRKAGMTPWGRIFHALRSSRETELAKEYPIQVVTTWLGNTPTIALKHYLLTTAADFDKAAGTAPLRANPVHNPVQVWSEKSSGTCTDVQAPHSKYPVYAGLCDSMQAGAGFQSGGHGIRTHNPFRGI